MKRRSFIKRTVSAMVATAAFCILPEIEFTSKPTLLEDEFSPQQKLIDQNYNMMLDNLQLQTMPWGIVTPNSNHVRPGVILSS